MTEPPKQLGPYTIDREIGRGGMGVVYLARDTRLDRAVAIKSLPEHLAQDPDRLARFEREARTLAALNHPNVAGIHGIEDHDGAKYLILEYVEGETLAERLDRGVPSLEETLELIVQIAAGVEAAHEAGIIHRDLKPANIKITPDGQAKVLDFGLAKADDGATSASSSNILTASPTITSPIQHSPTIPGAIMGTAPYMSPEQARGRAVDRRTDIWSFGVILYEMLTGDSPFRGETVSDSIAAILQKDLHLQNLPESVPLQFGRVLERCLSRDKNERYRHIGDVALDLLAADAGASTPAPQCRGVAGWLVAALVLLAAALGVGGAWLALQPEETPPQVTRFEIDLGGDARIEYWTAPQFALSPNGRRLYYVQTRDGRDFLYVRDIEAPTGRLLAEGREIFAPFVSPDGEWVAYFTEQRLMKIFSGGGSPIEITTTADNARGGVWCADDQIIYAPTTTDPLFRVSASGGRGEPVTTLDETSKDRSHRWPALVPGHPDLIVFTNQAFQDDFSECGIDTINLRTGKKGRLHKGGSYPRITPGGTLLFASNGTLYAAPLNDSRDAMLRPPAPTLYSVGHSPNNGGAQYAFANDGTLIHAELDSQNSTVTSFHWVTLEGEVSEAIDEPGDYYGPRISPDGSRFLYSDGSLDTGNIQIHEFRRGIATPLKSSASRQILPIWSPDGQHVAYAMSTDENAMPSLTIDPIYTNEPTRRATPSELSGQFPLDWSHDGEKILISQISPDTGWDILAYNTGSGELEPMITLPGFEQYARFSPDDDWILFTSNLTGDFEVFFQRADGSGVRHQVSIDGGEDPIWAPDSSGVYFLTNSPTTTRHRLMFAKIDLSNTPPRIDAPDEVMEIDVIPRRLFARYDIHPDGDRFLTRQFVEGLTDQDRGVFRLTLNWFEELEGDYDN